jgi:hypothetical protein
MRTSTVPFIPHVVGPIVPPGYPKLLSGRTLVSSHRQLISEDDHA